MERRIGSWVPLYHPSAVEQNKAKYAIPWAYDKEKLVEILRGIPAEEEPEIIRARSKKELLEATEGWEDFAYDLETPKGDTSTLYTASVSNGRQAVVVDFQFRASVSWLQPLFQRTTGTYVVQNGAFDMRVLRDHGVTFDWSRTFDTMIAGHVMDPNGFVALANLAALYLDVYGWKHKDEEDLVRYNACDSAYTFRVYQRLKELLQEYEVWTYLIEKLMPVLWEVIIPMMDVGVRINNKKRLKMIRELRGKEKTWRKRLDTHCSLLSKKLGKTVPVPLGMSGGTSYKRMTYLLYDVLKLPTFSVKGKVKADKHALKWLRPMDTIRCTGCTKDNGSSKTDCLGTISLLLEKSQSKKTETNLLSMVPRNGDRVHSRFILGGDEKAEERELARTKMGESGPRTGRLASRKPNLQNVTENARVIVIPSKNMILVERDYNQIEARITQCLSGDFNLLEAIRSGDVYLWTALKMSQMSNLYPDMKELTYQEALTLYQEKHRYIMVARKEAKSVFLGWSYRMGAKTLENVYSVPVAQGRVALATMNDTFPDVVNRWDELQERVAKDRFLVNPFGRKNYFWDLNRDRQQIANYEAQSTAADILFDAMRGINKMLDGERKYGGRDLGRMILTVHDQVLAEGPDVAQLDAVLKEVMERPIPELGGMVFPTAGRWSDKSWGEMVPI